MKKIFSFLLSIMLILAAENSVFAQGNGSGSDYYTSAGLKFYPGAFTFKHFIADDAALEFLLNFWDNGTRVTGLYEFHQDITGVSGLKWYAGLGAHLSIFNGEAGSFSPGVDGVVGLDFKVPNAPINFSLDWQPSIELGDYNYNRFVGDWGGLSIRYTFR